MTAAEIVRDECAKSGITVDKLHGKRKWPTYIRTRKTIAYRLRAELGASYPEIGAVLGRDHSTVMSYFRTRDTGSHRAYRVSTFAYNSLHDWTFEFYQRHGVHAEGEA